MQYVFPDRRTYITAIEFRNMSPIQNVERMRSFREEELVGTFIKKEFKWSFDNLIWNNWQTFNQVNLAAISFQDYENFYIHIKYSRSSAISGNIGNILLTYDSNKATPSSSIIDADLLQGENGLYYINNANHFGPSHSIKIENLLDSSGAIYEGRLDTSVDTTFYLKEIKGSGNVTISSDANSVILGFNGTIIDASIEILAEQINDLSTNKLDAVTSTLAGEHSIYSTEANNIAYIKELIAGLGTTIDSDASTITISVTDASYYASKYSGTFDGTIQSNYSIPATRHLLGTGPLQIAVYEFNEQIYTGVSIYGNGDVSLSWGLNTILDTSCKYVITG